jgi:hypothetical protein
LITICCTIVLSETCLFPMLFLVQRHRVVVPGDELRRLTPRQSVAFFVHPDDDVMIECLDGSQHYPPITSLDYLNQRLNATYRLWIVVQGTRETLLFIFYFSHNGLVFAFGCFSMTDTHGYYVLMFFMYELPRDLQQYSEYQGTVVRKVDSAVVKILQSHKTTDI